MFEADRWTPCYVEHRHLGSIIEIVVLRLQEILCELCNVALGPLGLLHHQIECTNPVLFNVNSS